MTDAEPDHGPEAVLTASILARAHPLPTSPTLYRLDRLDQPEQVAYVAVVQVPMVVEVTITADSFYTAHNAALEAAGEADHTNCLDWSRAVLVSLTRVDTP